jgi:hypothetical protein
MSKTLTAVFDGKVLVPDEPAGLEANRRYEVSVSDPSDEPVFKDAWDVLDYYSGSVKDAPEDWSLEHDHYIHGTPKRYADAEP